MREPGAAFPGSLETNVDGLRLALVVVVDLAPDLPGRELRRVNVDVRYACPHRVNELLEVAPPMPGAVGPITSAGVIVPVTVASLVVPAGQGCLLPPPQRNAAIPPES